MEFCEKLQELRKQKGLTQEELAEALYVSRTAVSKWESGRGYPGIDSLKEISSYFSVSLDDLLSGDKLISIAEKEHRSTLRNVCDLLFGMVDLFSFMLIVLPLYPKTVGSYIYSVNLLSYAEASSFNRTLYWVVFLLLIVLGSVKVLLTQWNMEKMQKIITAGSMSLSIGTVLFLAIAGEPYAQTVTLLFLLIKTLLLFKRERS